MYKRTILFTFPALLWTALLAAAQTIPRGYEIVDITRDNGLLEQFPRINNPGQVVFHSRILGHQTDSEIWLYDKGSNRLTQITDDNIGDYLPDIADDGTIVWMRNIGPDVGNGVTPETMMRTPDGVVTRITDNLVWDWSPVINNGQQIAWSREGSPACGGWVSDIYVYDGGNIVPITTNGESARLENQAPEINDLGDIVWTEYNFCNPPPPYNFTSRIMLYCNGRTQPVGSGIAPQAPALNNNSQIVWDSYNQATGGYILYLWDAGVETVLTENGANGVIDDAGVIAFNNGDYVSGHWNVWLWTNGEFLQVTGDSFDHIVPDINNESEIVWGFGVSHSTLDIRMLRRFGRGDLNCDGTIDAFDIEAFVTALFDPERYATVYPQCDSALADVSGDGTVNAFDIEPFVEVLFP